MALKTTTPTSSTATSFDTPSKLNKALQRDQLRQQDSNNTLMQQFNTVINKYAERYDLKIARDNKPPRSPTNSTTSSSTSFEDLTSATLLHQHQNQQQLQQQLSMHNNFTSGSSIDLTDVMFRHSNGTNNTLRLRGRDKVTVQDPVMIGDKNIISHLFASSTSSGCHVVVDVSVVTSVLKRGYADLCDILSTVSDSTHDVSGGGGGVVALLMPITQSVVSSHNQHDNNNNSTSTLTSVSLSSIHEMINYSEVTIVSKVCLVYVHFLLYNLCMV